MIDNYLSSYDNHYTMAPKNLNNNSKSFNKNGTSESGAATTSVNS